MIASQPQFQVGQRASFTKTITETDVVLYAGIVADYHPLCINAEYARKSRLGSRTAHAMLAGGLVCAVLSNQLPGPDYTFLRQQFEFLSPVFIGDTVMASVEVAAIESEKRIIRLRTDCHNQDGKQLLTGEAVLILLP
jgi:3-hydroxybutyryl-CoA dehydratase